MKSIFIFLINPFLGFLSSLADLNKRWHGLVFVAFYSLFGYAISFTLTSADSYRIGARFCQQDFIFREILGMYERGSITDVYMLMVFSIVKQYTDNPKILFAVLGAVLGGLAYLSVSQLYKIWKGKRTWFFYLLLAIFMLNVAFDKVNAIRFWTATAYFSFLAIQYLYFKRRYALFLIALSPLFHFGYIIATIGFYLFIVLKLLRVTTRMIYVLMLLTFMINIFTPRGAINDLMTDDEGEVEELSSNRAIGRKEQRYVRSDTNIERHASRRSNADASLYRQANRAYTRFFGYVNKWGMIVFLSFFYVKRKKIIQDNMQMQFFKYVLFSYAIGYIAQVVILNGGRFLVLANQLFVFWFFTVFQKNYSYRWKQYALYLIPINFYAITFILFNVPRLVTPLLWFAPPYMTIMDGIGFEPIDFVD